MHEALEKRILIVSADPALEGELRRVLARPSASPNEEAYPDSSRLDEWQFDSVAQAADAATRIAQAMREGRSYGLAVLDLAGLEEGAQGAMLHLLLKTDPALVFLLVPKETDPRGGEPAGEPGFLDRAMVLPRPWRPWEVRQALAAQWDRHRLGRELAETSEELASARRAQDLARQKTEEAERLKAQLMANVGHEIRTPMNAVLGFTRLLMKEPLSADQLEKLGHVHDASVRLLEIVENVLDFSRLSAGKVELRSTAFNADLVLREILESVRPAARKKGLALHCHTQAGTPSWLEGDSARFRQVVLNLLNNALKFTERGSIHLQTALDEETDRQATLRVVVTDTGAGIPTDRQAIIFDSFSQADGSATRQFGGLGLGMSIAKHLVELMGGQIGFRSQPGCGSSFWFTATFQKHTGQEDIESTSDNLPPNVLAPLTASWEPADAGPSQGPQPYRILAADDDKLSRIFIEALLSRAGCMVDLVTNGRDAVALNPRVSYDLVLMDIQMPEMDGREAIRRIRQAEATAGRHVPIIAMTAEHERQPCLEAGADDYLEKPFSPDALLEVIQHHLPAILCEEGQADQRGGPDPGHAGYRPEQWLTALGEAIEQKDSAGLENRAGRLKDLASQAGHGTIVDHALRIQLAARGGDFQRAAAALARLGLALRGEPSGARTVHA